MMDIGIIGLGNIATKAYLPLLSAWPRVRLHLASRDEDRAAALGEAVGAASVSGSLPALLAHDLEAVFVTAATDAHRELALSAIDAGVPVHVDKPLATSAAYAREIAAFALERGVPLAVGFNRRHAPAYQRLARVPDPHLVVMGKHREQLPDTPRRVVFDDMIHVVDTLLWLLGGPPDEVDVTARCHDGRLEHVVVSLATASCTAVGMMNRVSGATREVVEVQSPAGTIIVHDLDRAEEHRGTEAIHTRRGDWEPMLRTRGFEAMVGRFLDAAAGGQLSEQGTASMLLTHDVCETVVMRITDG